jgi:type IV secretion system protein TrbG
LQNFDDGGASAAASISQGLDVNHLDFGYKLKLSAGPRPEWFPVTVFNDGNKTYIELPKTIQEAPTLFIGSTGKIVNYRLMGNYYVVDSLFPQAQLRAGQSVVQINYLFRH